MSPFCTSFPLRRQSCSSHGREIWGSTSRSGEGAVAGVAAEVRLCSSSGSIATTPPNL
ncbi:hypothetical protein IC582_030516 [Cucumis melo]